MTSRSEAEWRHESTDVAARRARTVAWTAQPSAWTRPAAIRAARVWQSRGRTAAAPSRRDADRTYDPGRSRPARSVLSGGSGPPRLAARSRHAGRRTYVVAKRPAGVDAPADGRRGDNAGIARGRPRNAGPDPAPPGERAGEDHRTWPARRADRSRAGR